jgi:hypothetical protein
MAIYKDFVRIYEELGNLCGIYENLGIRESGNLGGIY